MSKSTSPTDQRDRFIRTAREMGCDENPAAFKRAVKKLAKAPPSTLKKRKARPAVHDPKSG